MINCNNIWVDIPRYKGCYQASVDGYIRSVDRKIKSGEKGYRILKGRVLKQTLNNSNYNYISISINGIVKKELVHRLICETFHKNINNKPCVNHIDGNKNNNHKDNLEWVTYSENHRHGFDNGLMKSPGLKGERNPAAKLTNEQVKEIRRLLYSSYKSREIEYKFNISKTIVSRIKLNKTYKDIK